MRTGFGLVLLVGGDGELCTLTPELVLHALELVLLIIDAGLDNQKAVLQLLAIGTGADRAFAIVDTILNHWHRGDKRHIKSVVGEQGPRGLEDSPIRRLIVHWTVATVQEVAVAGGGLPLKVLGFGSE